MRIGELLLEQRLLRQSDLARTLEEQQDTKRRLISLLIARGLIDFDVGARALGEQKGVACALAKHLAHRDPALASLIPAELGRASHALPIGKTSRGKLIVCVRDPAPALRSTLAQATRTDVLMVVAPATRLEHLIATAYGDSPTEEFDVDVESSVNLPPLPVLDVLDPDSVRLALTDLDDVRVAKDPSQSGQIPVISRTNTAPLRTNLAAPPPRVESIYEGLRLASSRDQATELVVSYVAGRWVAGLVVAIRDTTAIGYRGHGVQSRGGVEAISLPLALPSTIQRAVSSKRTSSLTPPGPAQEQLGRLLSTPSAIAATPVLVAGQVVAAIVVGDPVKGSADLEDATAELGRLGQALGTTYDRIRRS